MVNKEVARTTIKTEYFGSLTERMNKYREDVLNKKPYIDAERAVLATRAYDRYKEQPNVLKRAYMLKEILENMTIYIEEESMIAGNQASSNKDAPIFPEYTLEFVLNELDLFEKRDGDVFYITEETKEQLRSIAPFWENNNLRARAGALLPEEVSVYMETGFFGMEGKMNSGDAHFPLLKYGSYHCARGPQSSYFQSDFWDPVPTNWPAPSLLGRSCHAESFPSLVALSTRGHFAQKRALGSWKSLPSRHVQHKHCNPPPALPPYDYRWQKDWHLSLVLVVRYS